MYGKSASAGGASMTPSSVAWVCAVIEVMRAKTARGRATHRRARNRRRGGTSRAVEHAVLELPVALVRAHPASAMSKKRTVLLRTTSFSVEAGEPPGGARQVTVASDERRQSRDGGDVARVSPLPRGSRRRLREQVNDQTAPSGVR